MISSTYMSFFKAHYCILLDIVISSPILGSHESSASRRSHKKRIMLFRASARLQVRCDLCSQKTSLRHFTWSFLLQKKTYFTHQFLLPLFKRVESRIRCFKRFQISRFLVYSTPSLDTQLISQLSVLSVPSYGSRVAAMGGVSSKTNADEEDEYHDEVHDSKAGTG